MYDFTENNVMVAVKRLINELPEKTKVDGIPTGIVLGGQPGAGKTTIQKVMYDKFQPSITIINADEYRKYHPMFEQIIEEHGKNYPEYTGKFSGTVAERFLSEVIKQKRNIIIEGTLRTAEVPLSTCRNFNKNGYETILAVMATKPEISYLSTILRYEKMHQIGMMARVVNKEHHDKVVMNLASNLKKIHEENAFNHILIYNRQGDCICDGNSSIYPHEVLQNVITGKWLQCEIDEEVVRLKSDRNAPDLNNFVGEYQELIKKIDNTIEIG